MVMRHTLDEQLVSTCALSREQSRCPIRISASIKACCQAVSGLTEVHLHYCGMAEARTLSPLAISKEHVCLGPQKD